MRLDRKAQTEVLEMAGKKKPKAMPKWKAAPQHLVSTFERAAALLAGAEVRKMFGYPAAFLGGNMFAALHQERMILRLSAEDRALLLQEEGARTFEPMPGRPMREYVVVPESILASRPELTEWLNRAQAFAQTLPPKGSKKKPPSARSRPRA